MNKAELIHAVAEKAALSKKDSEAAVNATLEAISAALSEGEEVRLVGFGTFEVKKREARMGRNPQDQGAYSHSRLQDPLLQGGQGPEGQRRQVKQDPQQQGCGQPPHPLFLRKGRFSCVWTNI